MACCFKSRHHGSWTLGTPLPGRWVCFFWKTCQKLHFLGHNNIGSSACIWRFWFEWFWGFTDWQVCVSIQFKFCPNSSIEVTMWSSSWRLCPSAAKKGLNPVSATIHHAKMSLSKILKPCQLQGRWSLANPDDTVCVKLRLNFHPGMILLLLLYSDIPFFLWTAKSATSVLSVLCESMLLWETDCQALLSTRHPVCAQDWMFLNWTLFSPYW